MFLVSTYTSAKSWTSRTPFHSTVAVKEWSYAKSSSTSKISNCMSPNPSYQPCLSDEIRLHLLYSLLIMLNVTVGPIHCRVSFILAYIAKTLHWFFSTRTFFSFPRLRPSEDHSTLDPVLNGQHIKRMSGSIFPSNVSSHIYCEHYTVKRTH